MRTFRSCHWCVAVGVLRIHFTDERLPLSNFQSTRLFSIDDQHLIPAISLDSPDADYAQKRLWLRTNAFIGKVDFERLCCSSKQQRRKEASGCRRKSSNVFADYHGWPPFFLTNSAGM